MLEHVRIDGDHCSKTVFWESIPKKSYICSVKHYMMTIDTTNMCSHLRRKLFEENGEYHRLWLAMQDDPELTVVVRSRQLHIYRNGKKILVLAGKAAPKIIREDKLLNMRAES